MLMIKLLKTLIFYVWSENGGGSIMLKVGVGATGVN